MSGKLTAEQVWRAVDPRSVCVPKKDDKEWQAIADELNAALGGGECELSEIDGKGELIDRARNMARNIQGNLGRCLYRRKDVAEMEEVSEMLMELANELDSRRKAVKR